MKIIIATDGSEYSQNAVREFCRMFGKPEDLEVKVVSVFEEAFPVAGEPFAISAEYYQQLSNDAKELAEKSVNEAIEIIKENFPDMNPTGEVLEGSPERLLIEEAQEWKADLIIAGSHGRGFWGRMMVGSTSDALMHHAPCSVLIVREKK